MSRRMNSKEEIQTGQPEKKRKKFRNYEDEVAVKKVKSTVKQYRKTEKVRHRKCIEDTSKRKTRVDSVISEYPDSDQTDDSEEYSDSHADQLFDGTREMVHDISFGLEPNVNKKQKQKRPILSLGELVEARRKEELISSLMSDDAFETSVKQKQPASNSDEMKSVKSELSKLSLEELQQLKEKIGLQMYSNVTSHEKKQKKEPKLFQPVKKRPLEMSSKRRRPVVRDVVPVKKKVHRDPRFDDLSGVYNEEHFRTDYAFLDGIKEREKRMLKEELEREDEPERRVKISSVLNRMHHQDMAVKEKQKRKHHEEQWKQRETQSVQKGKKPFFLKQSDKRKLELADKFQELKQSGKLDNYLAQKRKKNLQKQRRKMPGERNN